MHLPGCSANRVSASFRSWKMFFGPASLSGCCTSTKGTEARAGSQGRGQQDLSKSAILLCPKLLHEIFGGTGQDIYVFLPSLDFAMSLQTEEKQCKMEEVTELRKHICYFLNPKIRNVCSPDGPCQPALGFFFPV